MLFFGTKLTKNTFAKGISKSSTSSRRCFLRGDQLRVYETNGSKLKIELGKNATYTEEGLQQDLDILEGESLKRYLLISVSSDTILSQLERLSDLLKMKMITEEEFQQLKQELLKK